MLACAVLTPGPTGVNTVTTALLVGILSGDLCADTVDGLLLHAWCGTSASAFVL